MTAPKSSAGGPAALFVQVLTTTDSEAAAAQIAQVLVAERLAGCVQIAGPVQSIYHWQGQIDRAREWLCTAKCRQADFARVEAAIRAVHPYETPEILAVPIVAGSQAYLDWLARETERPV